MNKKLAFVVGDVVRLRSGGPDMTVNSVPDGSFRNYYHCQWFAGKKLESGNFEEQQLLRVEASEK